MTTHLLYLVGQLRLGGLERQLCLLLHGLDRKYYQPVVVVWNFGENDAYVSQIRSLNVPLYFFPKNSSGWQKLLAFRSLVKKIKPHIIHSYSFYTNFAAWWGSLGTKRIAIGSLRNNPILEKKTAGKILGRLSACCPKVQICNSMAAKHAIEQSSSPFWPSHLHFVRNGLALERFKPTVDLPAQPVILAIGRLCKQKRWDRMIEVIAMAKRRNIKLFVRLAGEGPLLNQLKDQAKNLGMNEDIEFLGPREDVTALLSDAMFLLHTADNEGTPNVIMEAMACSRAVIATDAGDVPSLVEDGKTGFVVSRGDNEKLAMRINTLLADRELCQKMGAAGRAKAEREFGFERLVGETLAVYRSVGWKDN